MTFPFQNLLSYQLQVFGIQICIALHCARAPSLFVAVSAVKRHLAVLTLEKSISHTKFTVADRNKTESQNSKQNHKTVKQNRKTQNRITKLKTESQNRKTESQNSKQNHKTLKQNLKTQNIITKPKTESQNPKHNHKT